MRVHEVLRLTSSLPPLPCTHSLPTPSLPTHSLPILCRPYNVRPQEIISKQTLFLTLITHHTFPCSIPHYAFYWQLQFSTNIVAPPIVPDVIFLLQTSKSTLRLVILPLLGNPSFVHLCIIMVKSTDYGIVISSLLTIQNSDIIMANFRMGTNTDYPCEFLLFIRL